jgi:hypothetical protein
VNVCEALLCLSTYIVELLLLLRLKSIMTGSYGSLAAAGAIAKPDAKIQVLRSNCDDNKLALERAALLMVEAMSAEMKARPRSSILARRCHFLHTHMNKPAVLVVTLLLLLTFFERPYWCRANPVGCLQSTPQHGFITSGTPYIHTAVGNLLEVRFMLARSTQRLLHGRLALRSLTLVFVSSCCDFCTQRRWR